MAALLRHRGADRRADAAQGLPLAYQRDLQESVAPVVRRRRGVPDLARVMAGLVETLTVDRDRIGGAAGEGYTTATAVADRSFCGVPVPAGATTSSASPVARPRQEDRLDAVRIRGRTGLGARATQRLPRWPRNQGSRRSLGSRLDRRGADRPTSSAGPHCLASRRRRGGKGAPRPDLTRTRRPAAYDRSMLDDATIAKAPKAPSMIISRGPAPATVIDLAGRDGYAASRRPTSTTSLRWSGAAPIRKSLELYLEHLRAYVRGHAVAPT